MEYRNPPTVVVGLVPINVMSEDFNVRCGLMVVRRGLADGYGKLALPGGYQEEGETWQEATTRELIEETGEGEGLLGATVWNPVNIVTVQDGKINLLFSERGHTPTYDDHTFPIRLEGNTETLEVDVIFEPTELAFPAHTDEARAWFQRKSLSENV